MKKVKPPVVIIMGHVDHGKTSILDKIRKSNLAAKEAGQITQAIGAYQVNWKGKKITFLDTPGHEAFIKMRARGADVADVAVLVVAADDGVMPQTKESIKILKQAKIPFLVAINKIDVADNLVEKVKGQLAENEVFVEGYGGEVVAVPLSAKTGQGIDQLLEMILLVAEMAELKADPSGSFEGVVIESKKDHFRGSVATVIVKKGTLKLGDQIEADGVYGKVKSLLDEFGKSVKEAEVSQPAEISGWDGPAPVGAKVLPFSGKVMPKIFAKTDLTNQKIDEKKIRVILRADSRGSLEAIINSLSSEVKILLSGIGEICDSDILLAKTFSGIVLGFKVKAPSSVAKLAQTEKVVIKTYEIIYDLLKDLEEAVFGLMDPLLTRDILGKAEIIAEFAVKNEKIAGAKVISGRIIKTDKISLVRDEKIVAEIGIKSMKHAKEEITQAGLNLEFGAVFASHVDFHKGDFLVAWQ